MTTKWHYRVAACDLDSTLLFGSDLSRENRDAVQALKEHGVMVVLATGRNFHHAVPYYRDLGLKGPLVSSDGALVTIPGAGGQIICERVLPLPVSSAIMRAANRKRVTCLCFLRHGIYTSSKFDWHESMERHREFGRHFRFSNLQAMTGRSIYKLLLFSQTAADLDTLQKEILDQQGFEVDAIRNNLHTLELISKGISKVSGLQVVARHLGISPSQVMALGDGVNDVGMFRWAGLSVCMHHGHPTAQEIADMVAPPTDPHVNFATAIAALLAAHTVTTGTALLPTAVRREQE